MTLLKRVGGAEAVQRRQRRVAAAEGEAAGQPHRRAHAGDYAIAERVRGGQGGAALHAGAKLQRRARVLAAVVVEDGLDGVEVVRPDAEGAFAGALAKCTIEDGVGECQCLSLNVERFAVKRLVFCVGGRASRE